MFVHLSRLSVHRHGRSTGRARRALELLACGALAFACVAAAPRRVAAQGQAPFLAFDFAVDTLDAWFNPAGVDFSACSQDFPVIPSGIAEVADGELLLTNGFIFGITLFLLRPQVVEESFPDGGEIKARLRFRFGTASQLGIALKTRTRIDEDALQVLSEFERSYTISVLPDDALADFPDGVVTAAEFTSCHTLVPNPAWPGAAGTGFAAVEPGLTIARGDWYNAEVTAAGDEDGGPVTITASVWPDGGEPPALPQLIAVDGDGLELDAGTRAPESNVQFALEVSLDYPDPLAAAREPNGTLRADDIAFFDLTGCAAPPAAVERRIDGRIELAEGEPAALVEEGETRRVTLAIRQPRTAGECPAASTLHAVEYPPAGWEVSDISAGGIASGGRIVWDLDLGGAAGDDGEIAVSYSITAPGSEAASIDGFIGEEGSDRFFRTGGIRSLLPVSQLPPVSDFASIQHWLILGPFTRRLSGGAPGETEMARDYLTDGTVTETTIRPRAGDTIEPDYGGAAASTGLAPDPFGRNPGGVPRWVEWRDLDDLDDRIDLDSVYGKLDDVMCYAVTYLDVERDTTVSFGVSSDDSIQILLDGETIHLANVVRRALTRTYQDTPLTHPKLAGIPLTAGRHVLMAKIFEGQGEQNFRIGFMTAGGDLLFEAPPGITVTLDPGHGEPNFVRGDADGDGAVNITDAIFILNFLFIAGPEPGCPDAADANGDNTVNLSDAPFILGYLFLAGPEPPPPGLACGADPDADDLGECAFAGCP